MEFFIIVSIIIDCIFGYFLGRLFADGHKIRKVTDQIVFASPYIEHAAKMRRWAADRMENEWYAEGLTCCQQATKDYRIAQYYIRQDRLGKIPAFLMNKYDGNSDLAEYVNNFIENDLKDIQDLAEKATARKA